MLKEQIATRTLAWTDVDKFIFIWEYDLVIVYVDSERGAKKILTDHDEEVLSEIRAWLGKDMSLPFNPFDFEGEYGTETDWN